VYEKSVLINPDKVLTTIHGVSTEDWAEKFDIEPFSCECGGCGKLLTTTIPFAHGTFRGLKAPKCECGEPCPPYCLVSVEGDLFDWGGPAPQKAPFRRYE